MHYLTRQHLHISQFHLLMKVLMTLYILSVGVALWVGVLKYTDRAEWSQAGVAEFVHGSEEASEDTDFGAPFAGLDGDRHEAKSRRELVDIAHPHLFTVPLVLFILGHLLHLTRLPDALKLTVNVAAFTSFLATFLLPFAIVDDVTLAGALHAAGWVMLGSLALLCTVPLVEMWFGRPGSQGFNAIPRRTRQEPPIA